jgi:hypothetical protein
MASAKPTQRERVDVMLPRIQPDTVDRKEVTARVVEQVPRVDPGVRRIGYRCQRGNPKPFSGAHYLYAWSFSLVVWEKADDPRPAAQPAGRSPIPCAPTLG